MNSYANRNVQKAKFEYDKDDSKEEMLLLDMKFKGRPPISNFGKDIYQK